MNKGDKQREELLLSFFRELSISERYEVLKLAESYAVSKKKLNITMHSNKLPQTKAK